MKNESATKMNLVNDTNIHRAVEYIRTHEPPFEVFRIAREIHTSPLEVINALVSEGLQAEYKWRPCGVHDTQWVRYKTGTIKDDEANDYYCDNDKVERWISISEINNEAEAGNKIDPSEE